MIFSGKTRHRHRVIHFSIWNASSKWCRRFLVLNVFWTFFGWCTCIHDIIHSGQDRKSNSVNSIVGLYNFRFQNQWFGFRIICIWVRSRAVLVRVCILFVSSFLGHEGYDPWAVMPMGVQRRRLHMRSTTHHREIPLTTTASPFTLVRFMCFTCYLRFYNRFCMPRPFVHFYLWGAEEWPMWRWHWSLCQRPHCSPAHSPSTSCPSQTRLAPLVSSFSRAFQFLHCLHKKPVLWVPKLFSLFFSFIEFIHGQSILS